MVGLTITVISAIYAMFAEYIGHRWFMHKRFFYKGSRLDWLFEDHAIEHHKKGRNDIDVDLPVTTVLVPAIPLFAIAWLIGGILGMLYAFVGCYVYTYLWTKMHRSFHDLESNWTERLPWYKMCYVHHIKHHDHPNRNYGTVFPWSDYIFGTKIK